MGSFILLCVITAVGVIAWRFHQFRIENRLRENFPQRRVCEVSLPRGVNDSNKRMMKFYRKVQSAALGDDKARKQGARQLDVVYLAEVKQGHTLAEIRFLVYADQDKMDGVKRSLKQVFDGMADVMELRPEDDPMAEIANQLRPPAAEDDAAPAEEPEDLHDGEPDPFAEDAVTRA